MVEIKVEIPNLAAIKDAFNKAPAVMTKNLSVAMQKSVLFIREKSVKNAPVRTGRLRGSAYTSYSPYKGEIGFRANYAAAVHQGTKAHFIYPSSKKALFWKGAEHPVTRVSHPGTRANPFLQRAIDDNKTQIDKFFLDAVDQTLKTIVKAGGK